VTSFLSCRLQKLALATSLLLYSGICHADWIPDPSAGVIQFNTAVVPCYEGEYAVALSMTRTGGSLGAVSVRYDVNDGTAVSGSDYEDSGSNIYWGDGDTNPKTITIPIVNDSTIEDDESFYVTLSNPTYGATLGKITTTRVVIATRDYDRLPSYIMPRQVGGTGLLGGYAIQNAYHEVTGAGDLDGDAQEDIALGAAFERPDLCAEGAAYALWDLPVANGGTLNAYSQDYGRLGGIISGSAVGIKMTGVGDINGDGYSDFLVGTQPNQSDIIPSGDCYLILGSQAGVTSQSLDTITRSSGGVRIRCQEGVHWYANEISGAGDFNLDGYADFIMSMRSQFSSENRSYLVMGRSGFTTDTLVLDQQPADEVYSIPGFYHAAGLGDFNGDGFDDVTFGTTTGSLILLGTDEPLPILGGHVDLSQTDLITIGGASRIWGVGDTNGDKFCDVAVLSAVSSSESSSTVSLILGYNGSPSQLTVPNDITANGGLHIVTSVAGYEVRGLGDINHDGFTDFGVFSEEPYNGPTTASMQIVYGSAQGAGVTKYADNNNVVMLGEPDGINSAMFMADPDNSDQYVADIRHAGDVNLDGKSDFLVGNFPLMGENGDECFVDPLDSYLIHGKGPFTEVTYSAQIANGDNPPKAIGALGDGSHNVPFSRCWIDYDAGSSSKEMVTIGTDLSELSNYSTGVLPVYWKLQSNRDNQGYHNITFKYLNRELGNFQEKNLVVFASKDKNGPWKVLLPNSRNLAQNKITIERAGGSELKYFLLGNPFPGLSGGGESGNGGGAQGSDFLLWFKTDDLAPGPLASWPNSGVGTTYTLTQSNNNYTPVVVADGISSRPVVRFDGSNDEMNLPNYAMASLTQGEIFAVIKSHQAAPQNGGTIWRLGTGAYSQHPWSNGQLSEGFGSNTERIIGTPPTSVTDAHVYNVSAASDGKYAVRMNGQVLYSITNNTIRFNQSQCEIGYGYVYHFDGDIAEIIVFDRVLSDLERESVEDYLSSKFGLASASEELSAPANLSADGISVSQASLTWEHSSDSSTIFELERKLGQGGTYEKIAELANELSYLDSGLTTGSEYWYRARARRGALLSDWSNETSATTLSLGASVPLSDMALWLKADEGVTSGARGFWNDMSGNNRHAYQPTGSAQPVTLRDGLNGRPVVRFDGYNDGMNLPSSAMASLTQGEIFAVVKADSAAPSSDKCLWRFGTGAYSQHPWSNGQLSEGFGSNTERIIGTPPTSVTDAHVYNVSAASDGKYAVRMNGQVLYSITNNTIRFNQSQCEIGYGYVYHFDGDIAEIIVFDRVLTNRERTFVQFYLSLKYSVGDEDGDGLLDGWELDYFEAIETQNGEDDSDGDGLSNLEEFLWGSDPTISDSDGDSLSDYDEVHGHGTDPANPDTDGDGLTDDLEIANNLDPLSSNYDSDRDGLSDIEELIQLPLEGYTSNVHEPDTNGDEIIDSVAYALGVDPSASDFDSDTLSTSQEQVIGTSSALQDTDNDSVDDPDDDYPQDHTRSAAPTSPGDTTSPAFISISY